MRADGQRNRDALVAAATVAFARAGPDAPLDDIARRAGVGNATLYRHFPTRRDLLAAVYADELVALHDYAELLRDQDSPGEALHGWLRAAAGFLAGARELALSTDGDWYTTLRDTTSVLLSAAQRDGSADVERSADDLLALVRGVAVTTTGADQSARLLDLVRRAVAAA